MHGQIDHGTPVQQEYLIVLSSIFAALVIRATSVPCLLTL
jgi:hypothetical protein